jgi:signal transduction histidine kinase
MIRESLVQRGRKALVPAAGVLLCALLAWEAGVAVHGRSAGTRGARAAAALGSLHSLHAELDRLQERVISPLGSSEGRQTSRDLSPTAREAEVTARDFFRHDEGALQALDEAAALRSRAKESARASLLRRVDQPARTGPISPDSLAPDLQDVQSDLAKASRRLEQLEGRCILDLRLAAEDAGRGGLVLVTAIGAFLGLFAVCLLRERARRRHQRGARLVEDMLETYSRRLEAMNAQLEQVNLLKTQFLANTSHELLTPLNSIIGSLGAIRGGACPSVEDERGCLEQANDAAKRLLVLIRDLLDLCQLEEGNLALRCRQMEFRGVLERELAAHASTFAARDLVLLVTTPSDGWPRITGDPERVSQVVRHLLANAVRFTDHGSVRVTGRIEQGPPRFLRVEVADTGVGIEHDKLGLVFGAFAQIDASGPRRLGGAGLGLSLSRHLVQGMGGQIGIESDGPGRGTRVWFTLPLAPEATPAATGDESPDESLAA